MTEPRSDRHLDFSKPLAVHAFPGWVICFVFALTLYVATANHGPQWQDSGHHMLRIVTGESINPLGLALTHPLHHWVGRFAVALDLVEPAFAVTLISALAAACALANTYGCVLALTSDRMAAAPAAASLGVANTFWQLATKTETYSLTAALLSAECWCVVIFCGSKAIKAHAHPPERESANSKRGRLVPSPSSTIVFIGMFLFNGLGFANHNFALLTTPVLIGIAFISLRKRRLFWRHLALAAAAWLVGSLPYTGLIVAEAIRTDNAWITLHSALFGNSFEKDVLSATISGSRLLINAAFIALNFPNLLLPAAAYGLFVAHRIGVAPLVRWALVAALLIHATFALRFSVPDQQYFFIPMYVFLAIFGGVGFAAWNKVPNRFGQRWNRSALRPPLSEVSEFQAVVMGPLEPGAHARRMRAAKRAPNIITIVAIALIGATPILYSFTPALARRFDDLRFVNRHRPYRDDYVYLLTPWLVVERSADRMSREAVALAGDKGVIIVEDLMASFAVRYRAIREEKRGIKIVCELAPEDFLRWADDDRPIVLVPSSVERPMTLPLTGSWRRTGDLYLFTRE